MEQYEYISKEKCNLLDTDVLKFLKDSVHMYFKDNTINQIDMQNLDNYYNIQHLPLLIKNNKLLIDAESGFYFDIKKRLQNTDKFHMTMNRQCYNAFGTLTTSKFYYYIATGSNRIYLIYIFELYNWANTDNFLFDKDTILNIQKNDIYLDDTSDFIYKNIVFPLLEKEEK